MRVRNAKVKRNKGLGSMDVRLFEEEEGGEEEEKVKDYQVVR